ncbi:HEAT repeat domain-containing protein [Gottfriedia luciferensis]|uniref:HEAT repeat domain-containing protein n=1 Tax=Gottfriedia luciferensis TaxID=178774 RepID=UPI000B42E5A8|nr:HEAT repeat domain-containing protein [Gottfriedia luciferensis]
MDLEIIRKVIESDNVESAEKILEEIGETKQENCIPLLIDYLKSTKNHRIRNSIAIALSDIGSEKAIEPLIEMINDPKTLGFRGSLFYALKAFDCSSHLEVLVYHLLTGNFEVQANSFQLIEENINSDVNDEVLLKCILKVKEELNEIERQKEILLDALEMLNSFKKN